MNNLIFDRTFEDAEYALANPNSTEHLKGAYNYTDLNRVESNCEYIMNLVNDVDILPTQINLEIKTNWNVKDIPTIDDINRIRQNIKDLLETLNIINFEEIEFAPTMNYEKANVLEKNLYLIKEYLSNLNKEIRICGTFFCGAGGLYAERSD